jgi:hypothetical protein
VLRSDSEELQITQIHNIITVSVLDFRPPSTATFQDWINAWPYALTRFRDRQALRLSSRGIPTLHKSTNNLYGTDELIILSEGGDLALSIYMVMEDARACLSCAQIFDHIAASLVFRGF